MPTQVCTYIDSKVITEVRQPDGELDMRIHCNNKVDTQTMLDDKVEISVALKPHENFTEVLGT